MINTPLDAPTDFIPSAEERPAGQWMEDYWAEIAHWAKYFALAILVYFGWSLYNNFTLAFSRADPTTKRY